jgi:flagellar biosynthesis/type III secretory pathway protein FliH
MKLIVRLTTIWALTLLVANVLVADEAPAKKGKKAKKAPPTPAVFKLPADIELSPEQQAKFDELKSQYGAKLADAQKKVADILSEEQRGVQRTARKDAVAAGKKGKELKAAVDAAVELTDEQKTSMATAQVELNQLRKEIRKEIVGLLTADQRKSVKGAGKKQA